jgi:hypothetical protein
MKPSSSLKQLLGRLDAVDVRFRQMRLVDVAARENVADLADAVVSRVADQAQVVRLRGSADRTCRFGCARSCRARR